MQRQRRMEGVLRTHRRPSLPQPCFRVRGLGLRIEVSKPRWSREVKKCPVGKDGRSWDEGDSRRAWDERCSCQGGSQLGSREPTRGMPMPDSKIGALCTRTPSQKPPNSRKSKAQEAPKLAFAAQRDAGSFALGS